jgi:hypothetical protein
LRLGAHGEEGEEEGAGGMHACGCGSGVRGWVEDGRWEMGLIFWEDLMVRGGEDVKGRILDS